MVHWIFDDLAIDEYKLSGRNILNLCRKIVYYEHNVIGMVKFRRKMFNFWIQSWKRAPKYTKKHIIESLMTSQLMNTDFQKIIFWIYVEKLYIRSWMWLEWWNSDKKVLFFGSVAEKGHQKVHWFTPNRVWLEMSKINELLNRFILNSTHS